MGLFLLVSCIVVVIDVICATSDRDSQKWGSLNFLHFTAFPTCYLKTQTFASKRWKKNFLFCACENEKFYIICVETLNSLKPTPDPSSQWKIPPPSLWPAKHSSSICCMGKNAEPYICARHPWGPRNAQETEVPIPPWQPGIRSEGSKDRHYQHRMQHCDLHDTRGRTPTSVAGCVLGLASASPSFIYQQLKQLSHETVCSHQDVEVRITFHRRVLRLCRRCSTVRNHSQQTERVCRGRDALRSVPGSTGVKPCAV